MLTAGCDQRLLAAAAKIGDAYDSLDDAGRRVAEETASECPAPASDPRDPGPVLADPGAGHRRTAQLLTAAGGSDLQDAARRLGAWAEPVVEVADLQRRLKEWLPAAVCEAPVAALTRRLLCDAAGLAKTSSSTHAVSVAALEAFARAAMDSADDAGLIDEHALRGYALERGWDEGVFEALVEVCGFVELFGSLATRRNRFSLSKAALLDLRRGASRHEIAEMTGLTAEQVAMALATCGSIVRTGYNCWAAHRDPQFVRFAGAVAALSDDVGLIDEPFLERLASERGWDDRLDEWVAYAGYVRLNGQLAMAGTQRARVKAAVKYHGNGVRIEQIAETAELSVKAATAAARNIETVRVTAGTCEIVTQRPSLVEVARANTDDVGIVDVDGFAAAAAAHGHEGSVDELGAQCGLVELFGKLALKETTDAAVKAVLLDLARPAAVAELAELTGRSPKAVSHALTETESIVQAGRRWSVDTDDGAVGQFAAAAADAADDVGLIDEQHLHDFTDARGWSDRYDDLVASCGLTRIGGRLALDTTHRAAIKAAVLDMGRPATTREVAAASGVTAAAAVNVLATIPSMTRIRPSVWVTTDMAGGVYARFGAALGLCSDDAGLIDETQLRDIAGHQGWGMSVDELIEVCGLPRLHGTLAMDATAAAAAKAALIELGRPATLHELSEITQLRYGTINSALSRIRSVQRVSRGARTERGLLAVCDPEQPSS